MIGAGVAGLVCALELADRGAEVEIIDRGSGLGDCSCSWFAGGMLAPWCELATAEPLVAILGERSIAWWSERCPETVRPAFPDNMPRVRRRGRTVFVNGLFRHGFLLAPALAQIAADEVLNPTANLEAEDADILERQFA